MLSLIKIRVKYIIRKPCLLFWTYLFLPIIILIAAIVTIKNKKKQTLTSFESFILPYQKTFFNEIEEYPNIKEYLNFTGFLVDEENDCNVINSILLEFDLCQEQCPICTLKESSFTNYIFTIFIST